MTISFNTFDPNSEDETVIAQNYLEQGVSNDVANGQSAISDEAIYELPIYVNFDQERQILEENSEHLNELRIQFVGINEKIEIIGLSIEAHTEKINELCKIVEKMEQHFLNKPTSMPAAVAVPAPPIVFATAPIEKPQETPIEFNPFTEVATNIGQTEEAQPTPTADTTAPVQKKIFRNKTLKMRPKNKPNLQKRNFIVRGIGWLRNAFHRT